jgi:hypothetical protein
MTTAQNGNFYLEEHFGAGYQIIEQEHFHSFGIANDIFFFQQKVYILLDYLKPTFYIFDILL